MSGPLGPDSDNSDDTVMRRVVATGLGMVSPLATGVAPTWQKLLEGESGIGPIVDFDVSDLN